MSIRAYGEEVAVPFIVALLPGYHLGVEELSRILLQQCHEWMRRSNLSVTQVGNGGRTTKAIFKRSVRVDKDGCTVRTLTLFEVGTGHSLKRRAIELQRQKTPLTVDVSYLLDMTQSIEHLQPRQQAVITCLRDHLNRGIKRQASA